jgi:hypothetical protein
MLLLLRAVQQRTVAVKGRPKDVVAQVLKHLGSKRITSVKPVDGVRLGLAGRGQPACLLLRRVVGIVAVKGPIGVVVGKTLDILHAARVLSDGHSSRVSRGEAFLATALRRSLRGW